ncbi:hypothetical protein AZH53_08335 [Methanomicrobiaceae archaeon CYW5]|nr:hypothetical protein [Methanovulcanius yangii]
MTRHLFSTCIGIAILLLILGTAAPAAATDWGVNTTHYRELPSGPSYASATPIQGAIDAAATGDTITVEYGSYDEAVTVADKDLEITGTPSGDTLPILHDSSGTASALVSFTNTSPSFGGFALENDVSTDYGINIAIARNVTLHNVSADGFDVSAIHIGEVSGTHLLTDISATGSITGPNIAVDTLSGSPLTDTATLRSVTASGALAGEGIAIEFATLPVSFEHVTTTGNSLSNIRIMNAGSPDRYHTFTFSDLISTGSHGGNGLYISICRGPLVIRDANLSGNRGNGASVEYCGLDNTSVPATTTLANVTASDAIAGYGITIHECRGLLTLTNVTAERNHYENIKLDEVGRSGMAETILTDITATGSAAGKGIGVGSSTAPVTLDNVTATGNSLQNIWLGNMHDETTVRTVTAMDSATSHGIEIGSIEGSLLLSGVTASANDKSGIAVYTEGSSLTLQDVTANENGLSKPADTSFTETAGIWLDIPGTPAGTIDRISADGNQGPGFYIQSAYREAIGITAETISASGNLIGVLFSCSGGVFTNLSTSTNTFAGMMFDREASGVVVTDSTANENPFGIMLGGNIAGMAEITYDAEQFMDRNNSYYYDAVYDMSGCEHIAIRDCTAQDNSLWDLWVTPVASMGDITIEDLSTLPETTVSPGFSPSTHGLMMSGRAASDVPALPAGASSTQFVLVAATDPSLEYSLTTPLTFTVPGLSAGDDDAIWTSTGGAWTYWPGGGVRDIPNGTISLTGLDLTFAGTYVSPLTGAVVPTPIPPPETDSDSFDFPPVTPSPLPSKTPEAIATEQAPDEEPKEEDSDGDDSDAGEPTPTPVVSVPSEMAGTPTKTPFALAVTPFGIGTAALLLRRRR